MYNRLMFDNALQSDANARDKPIRRMRSRLLDSAARFAAGVLALGG
jgi:hypothetical protein